MSIEQGAQPSPGDSQLPEQATDSVASQRDLTGLILGDRDLMQILGVSTGYFYERKKLGVYDFLKCRPQLAARRTQYSGTLVQLWKDGGRAGERRPKPALVVRGTSAR